ncbi:MAG: hypothetical protein NXI11_05870 [Proteobacteria bacterium]|nr:hypothetical protein [Pseudomonadota bacterium]
MMDSLHTLNAPRIPDRPLQPVDDALLDENEYRDAERQAEEETAELVGIKANELRATDPSLLADAIDNLDADGLNALACLLNASADPALQAWIRGRFLELAADDVKPVDVEDVLRRWHP